jgi:drug/metabolite transporter (DMT)-like permease
MTTRAPPLEFVFLGLLALLWGASYLFIAVAVAEIPPITLIAIRVTIASAFLLLVLVWQGARLPRDAKSWRVLLVQAVLNSIGAWTVLAWGQQTVDSALASVLNSTAPLFVILASLVLAGQARPTGRNVLGATVGLLGVAMIVGPDALAGLGDQVLAQLAVLSGAVMYAGAALYGRRLGHLGATVTAAGTMIWAVAWLVPAALVLDSPWTLRPSATALASAGILGLFCTGIAMILYFRLIRTLGSLATASQAYLRAGVGVLLGVVVLGEAITPLVGLGIAAALIGVFLINAPSKRTCPR